MSEPPAATAAGGDGTIREVGPCDALRLDPRGGPLLSVLAAEGPSAFAANIAGTMVLIDAFGVLLPILVADPRPGLADVCSPVARYAGYPCSEALKRAPRALGPGIRLAAAAWGGFLRACGMERTVYVNNWLLSTNPVRALNAGQYRTLNEWLKRRYPGRAIVHRTVNPLLNPAHAEALAAAGCRLVGTRVVYVVDPTGPDFRRHASVQNDERLFRKTRYRQVDVDGPSGVDVERMAALYQALYIDKHSPLNAAFDARFFALLLKSPLFRCRLFLDPSGRIDAFNTYYANDGYYTGALIGHDLSLPKSLGLYRMAMMYKVFEAERDGLKVSLSGGCGPFKCSRGAIPVREYDAVDTRHLPAWRRLPWRLVELESRLYRKRVE